MKKGRIFRIMEMLNYYSDAFASISHINIQDIGNIGVDIVSSVLNYESIVLLIEGAKREPDLLASKGIDRDVLNLSDCNDGLMQKLWKEIDSPSIMRCESLAEDLAESAKSLGLGEIFLSAPLSTLTEGRENRIGIAIAGKPRRDYDPDLDLMALEIIASFMMSAITCCMMQNNLLKINRILKSKITEQRQAEEALRESEERYRTIFENTGTAMVIVEEDMTISLTNAEGEKLSGYPKVEIEGKKKWTEIISEEEVDRLTEYHRLRRIDSEAVPRAYETRMVDKCGNTRDVFVTAVLIPGTRKTMVSLLDITQHRKKVQELEVIAKVGNTMRTALTSSAMIPLILDQLLDLLKAEGAALAIRDMVTGETVIELAKGDWSSWTGIRLQPGEGVSGYVIANSLPYLSNSVKDDPLLARPDMVGDIHAVCCVPLIAHGQTIGALWTGSRRDITNEEVRLLTSIGDIAANAIYRATLYEQTERRMQKLTALHSIDLAITSSLDLRVTLRVLLDQVTSQLQVDAATILLLNPYSRTLEYAVGRGFRSLAIRQTRLRLGEGHAGKAALERRIISVPNVLRTDDACVRTQILAGEIFVAHHAVPLIVKGQVKGVLEVFHRSELVPDPEWLEFFEALAAQAAIAIDNASLFDELQRSNIELTLAYDTTLEGWSHALDMRDKETEGHTLRVAEMTVQLARYMGIGEADIVNIRRGALLHDIGKMGLPDSILLKPAPLSKGEFEIMRMHPVYAYKMLSPIPFLRQALNIPYCHHEKWDGTGYPRGLRGEQIPLESRIFAVVDVWDALRSDRPYRDAWSKKQALEYMNEQSGKHFDPKGVETFLRMIA